MSYVQGRETNLITITKPDSEQKIQFVQRLRALDVQQQHRTPFCLFTGIYGAVLYIGPVANDSHQKEILQNMSRENPQPPSAEAPTTHRDSDVS
jgi:hypothetical protein